MRLQRLAHPPIHPFGSKIDTRLDSAAALLPASDSRPVEYLAARVREYVHRRGREQLVDRLLVAALIFALWQAFSFVYGAYWVPSPWSTIARLGTEIAIGDILRHAAYTTSEVVLGFAAGGIPAIILPFFLYQRPRPIAVLAPFMAGAYGAPKLALAPLFVLWFGIGIGSKVVLVAVSAFFILYFNALAGVRTVDPPLIQMARVAGARSRDVIRHVVLPASLPYILAGFRIAMPYCIGGAVVAELLSSNRGLGYLVQFSATSFDTTGVFAVLSVLGFLVLAGVWTLDLFERCLLPPRAAGVAGRHS